MRSLSELPNELLSMIFNLLGDKDKCALAGTERHTLNYYHLNYIGIKPFLSTIKTELKDIIYPLPLIVNIYRGINDIPVERKLADDLADHKKIKSLLNCGTIKHLFHLLKKETWIAIDNYITAFEKKFDLPADSAQSLQSLTNIFTDFESYNKSPQSNTSQLMLNPIYLHMYLDLLHLRVLINSKNAIEPVLLQKIALTTFLLIRAGDVTGYLSLIVLIKHCQKESNNNLLSHISNYQAMMPKLLLNLNVSSENFVFDVINILKLFNLNLEEYSSDNQKDFIEKFDFLSFYFHTEITSKFIKKCLPNDSSLKNFLRVSSELHELFTTDNDYILYKKVFANNLDKNLEILQDQLDTHGIQYIIETLTTVSKNKVLFSKLSLTEILQLPQGIIDLFPENFKGGLSGSWSYENLCQMQTNLTKFIYLFEYDKCWSLEQIKNLMLDENEAIFNIIKQCEHRDVILTKFRTVEELILLSQHEVNEQKLLQLLCNKGTKELCTFLCSNFENAIFLIKALKNNRLLSRLISIKNVDLILKKFSVYLHSLRSNNYLPETLSDLDLLEKLVDDPLRFDAVLRLLQSNISKMNKEIKIVELFFNPILCEYICIHQLTLDNLKQHSSLFHKLFTKLTYTSHGLIYVPFKILVNMSFNLLDALLSIKSETLFTWILFGITSEKKIAKKYQECAIKKPLNIRVLEDIIFLFNSGIISALQEFGLHIKNKQQDEDFIHCDSLLLDNLDLKTIVELNQFSGDKDTTLFKKICSFNPGLFLCAIENIKAFGDNNILKRLNQFYSQPILEYLKISSHAWIMLLYFEKPLIQHLDASYLNGNTNALKFLLAPQNKVLFLQLIKHAHSNALISIKLITSMPQYLHCRFKTDTLKFKKIFDVLYRTNLLFDSNCLNFLRYYNADDLMYLSNIKIDNSRITNALELLIQGITVFGFNSFCSSYPNPNDVVEYQEIILNKLQTKKAVKEISGKWVKEEMFIDPLSAGKSKRKALDKNDENKEDNENDEKIVKKPKPFHLGSKR